MVWKNQATCLRPRTGSLVFPDHVLISQQVYAKLHKLTKQLRENFVQCLWERVTKKSLTTPECWGRRQSGYWFRPNCVTNLMWETICWNKFRFAWLTEKWLSRESREALKSLAMTPRWSLTFCQPTWGERRRRSSESGTRPHHQVWVFEMEIEDILCIVLPGISNHDWLQSNLFDFLVSIWFIDTEHCIFFPNKCWKENCDAEVVSCSTKNSFPHVFVLFYSPK